MNGAVITMRVVIIAILLKLILKDLDIKEALCEFFAMDVVSISVHMKCLMCVITSMAYALPSKFIIF